MSYLPFRPLHWFTIDYSPHPEERTFLARAQTRRQGGVAVTVAVPSDREAERLFGVRLARRGLQTVWLELANGGGDPLWLNRVRLAPNYYTPLEAAHLVHFAMGKRLVAFGMLGWLFLPLLPLLPFKLLSAHAVNRRLDKHFQALSFPAWVIPPGKSFSGFLFTPLDEGVKQLDVRLLARSGSLDFPFTVEVPGLMLPHFVEEHGPVGKAEELDEAALRRWLEQQPRCTTDARGVVEGDPLNLVIIGDRASIQECLSSRWDETEAITLKTAWKTAKAFLLESRYRYSPVSPLYLGGRLQDLALQRARVSLNQRLHLRLWATRVRFGGQPVWIGQVSRDIGVRFTLRTWNLTTHQIDPDVDEARNYVLDDLMVAGRVAQFGFAPGVEAAPAASPRRNLTGDPYFTDGLRAVAVLSRTPTTPASLSWSSVATSQAQP
jgi:LssY C-terminus